MHKQIHHEAKRALQKEFHLGTCNCGDLLKKEINLLPSISLLCDLSLPLLHTLKGLRFGADCTDSKSSARERERERKREKKKGRFYGFFKGFRSFLVFLPLLSLNGSFFPLLVYIVGIIEGIIN